MPSSPLVEILPRCKHSSSRRVWLGPCMLQVLPSAVAQERIVEQLLLLLTRIRIALRSCAAQLADSQQARLLQMIADMLDEGFLDSMHQATVFGFITYSYHLESYRLGKPSNCATSRGGASPLRVAIVIGSLAWSGSSAARRSGPLVAAPPWCRRRRRRNRHRRSASAASRARAETRPGPARPRPPTATVCRSPQASAALSGEKRHGPGCRGNHGRLPRASLGEVSGRCLVPRLA